jgi:two-component system response regulator FlrC
MTLSWVTGRVLRLSKAAMEKLMQHSWTENVRELEQILEAAAMSASGAMIEAEHLNLVSSASAQAVQQISTLAEMERKLILQTLQITQNNKSQAARLLGISIRTLRNKLTQYRSDSTSHLHEEEIYESNV